VSQPAFVDDRFLLYAHTNGGLHLVALDARSGATAWSVDASPAAVAPGQPATFAVVGTEVIAFRETSGQIAELIARNTASGRELWHSQPGLFTTYPDVCPANTSTLCVTGVYKSSAQSGQLLEFGERTGAELHSIVLPSSTTGARSLGSGLFDPGTRNPDLLVSAPGSRAVWEKPLASIFTTPGASTDYGWNFSPIIAGKIFVGSVGARPHKTAATITIDLSRTMTAGFRAADGSVVWRSPGTTYVCTLLPCPGGGQGGFTGPADLNPPVVGLRLRETGTETAPAAGGLPRFSPNVRVALEGFKPTSDRTLWTFNAGHDTSLGATLLPQLGNGRVVLPNGSGDLIALDLVSGARKRIAPTTDAWCRSVIFYNESVAY
jgi:outer membrane protein assembly factor BamB